jgi:hypothetical protein
MIAPWARRQHNGKRNRKGERMRGLSISKAWDETKAIVGRDGQLFVAVALALVALPTAVTGVISPSSMADTDTALWMDVLIIAASLIALAGQLALIRLAIGPSITVGAAIGHGLRRMPIYFLAVLLVCLALAVAAIPLAFILAAAGVQVDPAKPAWSPALAIGALAYLALFCFVGVRMLMAAPAASAEHVGPIATLRRSWTLTGGHWWQLFGFLMMFFIGAIVLLLAISSALGLAVTVAIGPVKPMSASALIVALVQSLASAAVSTLFAVMLARIYVQLAGGAQASVPTSGT